MLDVNGAIKINNYITTRTSGYTSYNLNAYYDVSTWRKGASGYARRIQMGSDNGGSLQYSVSSAGGSAGDSITWSDKVVIKDDGNVGIGTSSPTDKLVVSNGGANTLHFDVEYSGGASTIYSYNRSTSVYTDLNIQANNTIFKQGATERMRITSVGNVGLGNAGYSYIRLNIVAQDTGSSNYAINIDNSSNQTLFYIRNDGFINTGLRGASPYNNSTSGRAMVIESGGGLGYLVSTRESKANINHLSDVSWLYQLNPVSFNYRKKDLDTNTFTDELYENTTYGFIADEVEKVNKELVFYKEDGSLAGVEYNNMIAILTKAVQELKAEIDELKNK